MKKKNFLILFTMLLLTLSLTGCSLYDEADVVSKNISKEADNFNVYRKITIINNQSDVVMLEFEGWCSIAKDNEDNQLEVTYRIGEDSYAKDFIGLNDRTSYLVTQLDGKSVDKYHFTWMYHSKGDLVPIEMQDNDSSKKETDK